MSQTAQVPLVSVIMPVYNAERYVAEAIESILSQTYTNLELIVLDDNSTDNSISIINRFQDERIKLIKIEKNGGIAATLNRGLAASKGKYIARMDADDIALPHRLMTQIQFLEDHPAVDFIGSCATVIDEDGKKIGREIGIPASFEYHRLLLLFVCKIIHPSILFRSKIMEKVEYKLGLGASEDYELWTRLFKKHRFHHLSASLLLYRIHTNNSVKQLKSQAHKSIENTVSHHFNSIGIDYTKEDFEVHRLLFFFHKIDLEIKDIIAIEDWLVKIQFKLLEVKNIDTALLAVVLDDLFYKTCLRVKGKGLRILQILSLIHI